MNVLYDRNRILYDKHRGYHHLPTLSGDVPEVNIYGKNCVMAERRPLDVKMNFPEGPKIISWPAYFYSGQAGGISLNMKELREHMHIFLCDFYGLNRVRFRFSIGDNILAYEDEAKVPIESYLCLTHRVQVTVLPEEEGGAP